MSFVLDPDGDPRPIYIDDEPQQEWMLSQIPPNTWVDEKGKRHIYVWDGDVETRYVYEDGQLKILKEIF